MITFGIVALVSPEEFRIVSNIMFGVGIGVLLISIGYLAYSYSTYKKILDIQIGNSCYQWTPSPEKWDAWVEAEWGRNGRQYFNWTKGVIVVTIISPIGNSDNSTSK